MQKIIALSGKQGSGKNEVGSIIQYLTSELNEKETPYNTNVSHFYSKLSNWKEHSFAYKVREALSAITGIPIQDLLRNDIKQKTLEELTGISWKDDNDKEMTVRRSLQKLGTDAVRFHFHEDTWVKSVQAEILKDPDNNHFITDLRFENEMLAMDDLNTIHIRINRYLTSEQWHNKFKHEVEVIDPDGWDRKNFEYSWYKERISQKEFEKRLMESTCKFNLDELSFRHQSEIDLDNIDLSKWDHIIDNDTDDLNDLVKKVRTILEHENII